MRWLASFACALGCAWLAGCGTVGEPLYPALKIPARVTDLTAVEKGDRMEIHFSIPPLTTEGLALTEIGSVDLRIGPSSATPFNAAQWANGARRIEVPPPEKPGPVPEVRVPVQQFVGQDVIVGVRVANAKGRNSEWSNFQTVTVEPPLARPSDLKAEAAPEGVALTWNGGGSGQFRLYRQVGPEEQPALLATTNEPKFVDTSTEYGKTYQYFVESLHDKAESDLAGPVSITPADVFPPHVPTGLTASAGLGSIELAWDRNTESDFKEYRVYRSVAGGRFVSIAEGLAAPSYSDHNVDSGKLYRYRVAAQDQAGNLSEPCDPVEIIAP